MKKNKRGFLLFCLLVPSAAFYLGCSGADFTTGIPIETDSGTGSDAGGESDIGSSSETSLDATDGSSDVQDAGEAGTVVTCVAGSAKTVDNVLGTGAAQTAVLIHFASGSDDFLTATPSNDTFTGKTLPGQMVVAGKNGIQFGLKNGSTNISKLFYLVNLATVPSSCSGSNLYSQGCAADIAKAFRCQYPPYLEKVSCPSAVTFSAQPSANSYTDLTDGDKLLLVDLTCGS